MYPWLRVMYAVVVIGSRIRRSACGMNLSTFWACAHAEGVVKAVATASVAIKAAIERSSATRLAISLSGRKGIMSSWNHGLGGIMPHPTPPKFNVRHSPHFRLRRRLRHLPLLGRLLAGPDGRARRLSSVSGRRGGFPGDRARGVSSSRPVHRARPSRVFP